MLEHSFVVKFVPSKNCFCYVSPKILKELSFKHCLKVSFTNNVVYVSLGPSVHALRDDEIGINPLFAKALNLTEHECVTISEEKKHLPIISRLTVSTLSKIDYEVLELMADELQNNLLSQIRILTNGEKFVAWTGRSMSFTLLVEEIYPISPGCIDNFTELEIKPFDAISHEGNVHRLNRISQLKLKVNGFNKTSDFINTHVMKPDLVFRVIPLSKLNLQEEKSNIDLFDVFVMKRFLPMEWKISHTTVENICSLKVLASDEIFSKKMFVKLCSLPESIEGIDDIFCLNETVFIKDELCDIISAKLGERIFLRHITNLSQPQVEEIQICSSKVTGNGVVEKVKRELANACETKSILLNNNVYLHLKDETTCQLKISPPETEFVLIDSDYLRNCHFVSSTETALINDMRDKEAKAENSDFIEDITNFKDIIKHSTEHIRAKLNFPSNRENILIIGKSGMGKSSLLSYIKELLSNYPYFTHASILECKKLKGKTLESLHKLLIGEFNVLINRQPSLLLVDDLNILCEHVNEGDAIVQNSVYFNRVSEMMCNMLNTLSSDNLITVIAMAESVHKLNKNIYESRGNHLFQNIFTISDLNKDDKIKLFQNLFSNYNSDGINLEDLSIRTEGYVIQDIVDFSKRAIFGSYKNNSMVPSFENCNEGTSKSKITKESCEQSLLSTSTITLHDIKLHSPGKRDFSDIGGLQDVKNILIENLLWPALYPKLFEGAPLRLQSGLLLFGPPGTGKTILAGAAAKHCGLRLISVKGPELLSKYIGASEQAVRDIFEKAQKAKPCILFFDEFDSLAPRRGHDNTGVTDRVVNQLLTQLDGVESLTGVCLLAATSRPDLLDPALLRPGRLDRQILCPLPDQKTRFEILKILSKCMKLSSDVNLKKIAANSDGFSGADLQSVLYTAQLAIVETLINNENDTTIGREVSQELVENSLMKTRPSLSTEEKKKYDIIYKNFQTGNTLEFRPGSKTTLA